MAKENVRKFYEEVSKNKELQKKLMEVQKNYSGNKEDRDSVVKECVIPIAKEAGYDFTAEEVLAVDKENALQQNISEEELENVSGGWSACWGIGAVDGWSMCFIIGGDAENITSESGGFGGGFQVCLYVGIGTGLTAGEFNAKDMTNIYK